MMASPDNGSASGYRTPIYPDDEIVFAENTRQSERERRRNPFSDTSEDLTIEEDGKSMDESRLERNLQIERTIRQSLERELMIERQLRTEMIVGQVQRTPTEGNIILERQIDVLPQQQGSTTTTQRQEDLEQEHRDLHQVGFRDRVSCYTWTWFTMTMATGGIASVLHSIPYQAGWLTVMGVVVFFFNLVLFLANCVLLTLRFTWNPGALRASFVSQSESLFIPACVVSSGIILTNMCQYGMPHTGPWFERTMEICFWAYVAVSFIVSSSIYLIIWSTQTFPIHTMTPIWIFPAYPLLITATFASNFIDALPDPNPSDRINTIAIAFGAICTQGTGFCVSLMIYSAFIYRLMSQKLPRQAARPGMFVSVGPSAFTVGGIVGLGNLAFTHIFPEGYQGNTDAAFFAKMLADLVGIWLWGLALWFFLVSIGAHWQTIIALDAKHQLDFDMTWFSFVFPNTALVNATYALARSVKLKGMEIFATVLATMVILLWLFVFGMMFRALVLKRLLWPKTMDGKPVLAKKWTLNVPQGRRSNCSHPSKHH